jgi:hypothetical protein
MKGKKPTTHKGRADLPEYRENIQGSSGFLSTRIISVIVYRQLKIL